MKKTKLFLAVSLAVAAQAALAYDTLHIGDVEVTPYARIVAGLDYTKDIVASGVQGDRFQIASNQWGTSFWGVTAAIPLTDGWKGIANLESGFGTNTGQTNNNGTLFNRDSNVGVTHEKFGTLTIGNHMWISNDSLDLDPMGQQWMGLDSLAGGRNWGIGPNTLLYRTPVVAGLQASYMHMAGGAVDATNRGSGNGLSLSYISGPLTLRVIGDEMADAFGRYTGGANYGLGSQGEWRFTKEIIAGGSYQLGAAKLFAGYNRITAPDADYGLAVTYDTKAVQTWLGVNYKLSEKLTWLGAVYHLDESVSGKKTNLFTTGLNYDWNKYFTLYATVGSVHNNTISDSAVEMDGANNHALYYWNTACGGSGDCNGASSFGAYAGFALKF